MGNVGYFTPMSLVIYSMSSGNTVTQYTEWGETNITNEMLLEKPLGR
jgi:hypothetical protein